MKTTDRSKMFYWQVDRPFDEAQTAEIFLRRHEHFDAEATSSAVTAGMRRYGLSAAEAEVVKLGKPVDSGSVNNVVHAELKNGWKVVIREHPDSVENGYFWVEKAASAVSAEKGIPTYRVYDIDDSLGEFPFAFMICSEVRGTIMNKTVLDRETEMNLVRETGSYAAKIHMIATERYGFFDNGVAKKSGKLTGIHDRWDSHFLAALGENLAYLRDHGVLGRGDVAKVEKIISANASDIQCGRPVLIHNDIADWNEIISDGHVTGIMDWDECFSGDPVMEFAAWRLFFPEERFAGFVEGYRRVAPLPDGFEQKMPLYKLRYAVSKAVIRRKKLGMQNNLNMQSLLDHAVGTIRDIFLYYGI